MLDTINKFCKNYTSQLPKDGLKAAGLSAIYSFSASMIYIACRTPMNQIPNDLSRAGLAALVGFTAATIHALTTPIFNYFFENPNNYFNKWEELVRNVVSISLAHIMINQLTMCKVNLITPRNLNNENYIVIPSTIFKAAVFAVGGFFAKLFKSKAFSQNTPNQAPIYVTA